MFIQRNRPWKSLYFAGILALVAITAVPVVAASSAVASSLIVESQEKSGIYPLGKEVVFTIKPAEGAEAVDLGTMAVTITRDGWEKVAIPEAKRNGALLEARFTPAAAGWYMCEASPANAGRKAVARAGVVVSPEKVGPSMPEPKDFDEFWNARRAALAAMPLKADLKPVEVADPQIECVSIEASCPQTNPVRGYYARPKEAKARSCPAILFLRAAGVSGDWCKASVKNAASLARQYGAIVLDINAHGMLNGQPPEYYRNLEQGELRNYWTQGTDDRDKFYFVGMYVRLLRSIEFLAAQEQWDGKHLITIGESQGGGQALAAAGLDKRVSAVVALVPAMCDFTGPVAKRAGGWPQPVGRDVESEHTKKVIDAVRYCDNVNLATRSRAETLVFVGLVDTTCSAPGVFAVYNSLPGNKRIVAYPHKPHSGLPKEDAWIGDIPKVQEKFIRRHIAIASEENALRPHDEPGEPPAIPVGLDAYRQWNRWPYQRIGARAYMRSTYDRRGGNEGADASHFLYQLSDDFNVSLDVAGPGVLYFARYNHWHGSPWHYEVDGVDRIIRETGTADPVNALKTLKETVFIPELLFPSPLAWTWSTTKGADLMWVPLPFERTFRMAYSRTRYGTGYYIYHLYDRSAPLSQLIHSWDGKTPPAKDVLDLLNRAGTDLAPRPSDSLGVAETSGELGLAPKQAAVLTTLTAAPSMVRAIELSVPKEQALAFGHVRLRVTWDGRREPSIDAPVALFFGAGTLYNRDGREFLVKGFPVHICFTESRVRLACYFPMPFFKSAKLELAGDSNAVTGIRWRVRRHPLDAPANHVGYFHATYRDHPAPEPGQDLLLLDTRTVEGSTEWSGSFVGSSWIFSHRGVLNTLEGDPRFFFDDSQTPQAYGTGTEEWGGGGDYWGGLNMTLPLAGHPCGARNAKEAKCDEDLIESAYRFLLADLMPFGRRAVIRLEHGGENQSTEHYETVAYWYGLPAATLVQTDDLKIGDAASEREHRYDSPQAGEPYEITSRYEGGPDTLAGKEIYPPHTDIGRKTAGASEFTVKLAPQNFGVLLRRKLDYSFPNQRAEVSVAGDNGEFKPAGIWYLAGGNTCVYSNPKEELGATQHIVQTSNRRFRDDEFLVPRDLTQGRSQIRIRVQFTPVEIPLFPGRPLPELAWSEIRYTAYCWVMPQVPF